MSLEEIIREKSIQQKKELNNLDEWAKKVKTVLGPCTIILFGSYARGDFNLWSDLDLLLVSDYFESIRFLERTNRLPELNRSTDLICWTMKDFKISILKPSWKSALRDSIVIADDYNISSLLK